MSNNTFIRCSDKETIDQLKKLGYKVMTVSNGVTTFLNDASKPQSFDKKKVAYTNIMLCS